MIQQVSWEDDKELKYKNTNFTCATVDTWGEKLQVLRRRVQFDHK